VSVLAPTRKGAFRTGTSHALPSLLNSFRAVFICLDEVPVRAFSNCQVGFIEPKVAHPRGYSNEQRERGGGPCVVRPQIGSTPPAEAFARIGTAYCEALAYLLSPCRVTEVWHPDIGR